MEDIQGFCDIALSLAEDLGIELTDEEEVASYLEMVAETVAGMAPMGSIGIAGKKYPGAETIAKDGQHVGPESDTRSADEKKAKGAPKAESMHSRIYNSLAGKKVRESINMGRNPSPKEVKEIAESEGFKFDNWDDVSNFMKVAIHEKLYPVTGPTGHANQMKGDGFPALSSASKEMQRLGPKDTTVGQNSMGARDAKTQGLTAPHSSQDPGPKGSTRQFEQDPKKLCPVCQQKNNATRAHCGGCGATLPAHPESRDPGTPMPLPSGPGRNTNVASDGGLPKVSSPYGGSKAKNYYLKAPPAPMKESMPESSRMVLHDLLESYKRGNLSETDVDYKPHDVLSHGGNAPGLSAVNAKMDNLGLNPITQDELDRVVGLLQQGQTVGKVKLYTGVDLKGVQQVANMMGLGASHGIDSGLRDYMGSSDLA